MKKKTEDAIIAFFERDIRSHWEEKEGKWYYAAVDVIRKMCDCRDPGRYWRRLKKKASEKGYPVVSQVLRVKMRAENGRMYVSDVIDMKTVFGIVQLLPSAKADSFREWLAKAGEEQYREIKDPERSLERALDNWRKMGRDEKWILRRMMSQETRHRLTEYWGKHGITEGEDFRRLTNTIHEMWSGLTIAEHKTLKGLKSHNLRDHMNEAELIFTALAEMAARQIAENKRAVGYEENASSAEKGGRIARNARKGLEEQTGKNVLSEENFLPSPVSKKTQTKNE